MKIEDGQERRKSGCFKRDVFESHHRNSVPQFYCHSEPGLSGLIRSMEINSLPRVSRKGCSPADILIPGHWDSEPRSQPCLLSPHLQMTKVGWFKRLYLWRFILAAIENGEEKGSNIHPVNVSKLNYPMMKATCRGCAYQYRHKPPPCRAEAGGG